jgi:hypothetical protein
MRLDILSFSVLAVAGLSSWAEAGPADLLSVHTATAEPGVIPPGTSLVVRTNDIVRTHRAFPNTIYVASLAKDVLDQDGGILIPKESVVELVVRLLSYLGPGGVGMTELALDIQAVTVKGVRYPVGTETIEEPNAGGLELNRHAAKWVGGVEAAGQVLTRGRRINVPAGALLAFQIEDPIRLRGYRR